MAAWISCSVWVSMEEVASSKTKILGLAKTARAKEMSCFFAGGQAVAAFADVAVPALFQLCHHGVGGDCPGGGFDLLVGGIQAAVADVLRTVPEKRCGF